MRGRPGQDIQDPGSGEETHRSDTLKGSAVAGGDTADHNLEVSAGLLGADCDSVDLDALFDTLGVATAELRAVDVKITDTGADGVLTIDGVVDFSITFTGEDFGGDGTFGQFSAAQLALLGIDVGTL